MRLPTAREGKGTELGGKWGPGQSPRDKLGLFHPLDSGGGRVGVRTAGKRQELLPFPGRTLGTAHLQPPHQVPGPPGKAPEGPLTSAPASS